MALIHVKNSTKDRLDRARDFYCETKHISKEERSRISYNMIIVELLEEVKL